MCGLVISSLVMIVYQWTSWSETIGLDDVWLLNHTTYRTHTARGDLGVCVTRVVGFYSRLVY